MNAEEREKFKMYQNAIRSMPTFSNKPDETWREFEKAWLVWYERDEIENLAGIPKQKMALLSAMRGRAMRAVDQHGSKTASFGAAATLTAYLKLIRECFNPPSESQTARTDFERLKQDRQVPAVVYLAEKRSLYYHAFPETAQRSFQYFKSEVLKGLYASYVKEKIIERDPASEAALETCIADAVGTGRALYFSRCGKIADLDGLASTTHVRASYIDGTPASVEVMDFEESGRRAGDGNCHTCNKPGHFARNCPKRNRGAGQNPVKKPNPDRDILCLHCKKKGHRKANCWQLHPELKKGPKGGAQPRGGRQDGARGGQRNRRVGNGDEEEDLDDAEDYADFAELDDDEVVNRLHESDFRTQTVPRTSGRGNRLN